MNESQHILISRTDAIGDVVLSLPLAGILKKMYPKCFISFLGQTYTKEIVESCVYIDKFLDWQQIKELNVASQVSYFKQLDIDVAIHVYPRMQISWLLKQAKVPVRIGTSHRWHHWLFCNRRVSFSRRRSNLHEAQLNTHLLLPLGLKEILPLSEIDQYYGLVIPPISNEWASLLDNNRFNLILHPKSRGNGIEWGLDNYSKLISLLDPNRFKIFITGTQNEQKEIDTIVASKYPNVVDLVGQFTLKELITFIANADGLVASGTGTLHLAAATGIHAIGLFPPVRPVFSRRWAPIGVNAKAFEAKKTCFSCKKRTQCDCLHDFSPTNIVDYLEKLSKPKSSFIEAKELINDFAVTGDANNIIKHEIRALVMLDKMNKPNCGLGRVAIDFSRALINQSDSEVKLTFVLNGTNNQEHIEGQRTQKLSGINRLIPAYYGRYDILHKLHQTPSFKVSGTQKVVLTIHDLNFLYTKDANKSNAYLKKVQRNVDNADAIVFISNFTKNVCLQHLKIAPDKIIKVIYNGVELPSCSSQKPSFLSDDEFLFSIGQFLSKKNFHVLIPFIEKLPSNIKLVISGENNTSYGTQIRKAITDRGLSNRIILSGPISEAEKLYLYQNCKAFVFPSLSEGFGLPIIEAMRAGRPVFCSDKTSLKEIGDQHVYFWSNFDPDSMSEIYANGISQFNEESRKSAYNYSLKYTWETNAQEYLELYKSLML